MPTRDRIINIINHIINNNNNNNNRKGKPQDRTFWKAVIRDELTRWSLRDWAE